MCQFKIKLLPNKKFFVILVTSLIAHATGGNAAAGNHRDKYLIGDDYNGNGKASTKGDIFYTEKLSNAENPNSFLVTADETKDHSERAKIDLFLKDISKRVNPLYAKKNGFSVSYATQFHDSRSRSEEYLKPDATIATAIRRDRGGRVHNGEEALGLGITFQDHNISQRSLREGENMAQVDLRNGDIDRQKDKLAHDAATFPLIQTQVYSSSRDLLSSEFQPELTHVSVENEKGSQGNRMKDHNTQKNHPDTPWTRTKGFLQRLLHSSTSIGTRLTRDDENFKQVSNNPLLPISDNSADYYSIPSYQRSGSPSTSSSATLQSQGEHMNVAFEKDLQDIEHFYTAADESRYGLLYRHPISKKKPISYIPAEKIHRMKRNAAGDQFSKNLSSNLPLSTEDEEQATDSLVKVKKVHSEQRSFGEVKEDPRVHSPSPQEALERLKLLVGKIVQELSQFKQKFTLRLIRMTEKDDLTRLPEIMKDFQITPERPIFFIAGGLKALPVVPTSPTTTENEEASASETVFTATSTLGTTTSSEFLRDTIPRNETTIALSHATDSPATTFTPPEVETTTTQEPSSSSTSSSSSYLSFPQVLTAWFTGGMKSAAESTSTTSEKGFTESHHNEFLTIESSSEMPNNSSTIVAADHFEIDSPSTSTTNPTTITISSTSSPVDRFTSEFITVDDTDSTVTESFFDSSKLIDSDRKDPQDQHGKKLSRKKRAKTMMSVVDTDEVTFYLSPPERMARTENPFEDSEPGVYYPILPSFYGLTPWPYEHHLDAIRQSQNVRDDDSSDLTDVDEGLLLLPNLMLSSPTPQQPNNKEDEESTGSSEAYSSLSRDPQRESRTLDDDQREVGINLHNINRTLPSPGDSSALSRVHQTLLPSTVEGLNTLANVDNSSQVYEQVGTIDKNDNENITPLRSKKKEPSLKALSYNIEVQSKQPAQDSTSNSRAAAPAYSKVVRSGSTTLVDASHENRVSSSRGNDYYTTSKSDDAKQHETLQDVDATSPRNSSNDKNKATTTSLHADKLDDLEMAVQIIDPNANKVTQPSNQQHPLPTSTFTQPSKPNDNSGVTILLSPEFILNPDLGSSLKSRTSSTKSLNGTSAVSRNDFKGADFKEMESGKESIHEFQTKVVAPIIILGPSSSSVAEEKSTKPISSTPTDTVGGLKEKNANNEAIKSSNTKVKVNMPEKVLEKVNSKFLVAPDPEVTIESPHHITIIASGTVINSDKMRNMSSTGIPLNVNSNDRNYNGSPPTQEVKGTGTSNETNETHSGDNKNGISEGSFASNSKTTTEKPLEINVKISSPIIDAATSIIQSIFGFGTVPASNSNGNGSVTTFPKSPHNTNTKTETVSVDRKKENNSETQSSASSSISSSSSGLTTSESNVFNATNTTTTATAATATTVAESQSLLVKVNEESVSNLLSTKDVISSHESSSETGSHLPSHPTLPKLDDNHNSHSFGDPPKVTLTNNLTSAELFNEQQNNNTNTTSSFVVNTLKKNNEPKQPLVAVAVAANFDKESSSHLLSQPDPDVKSPISNFTESGTTVGSKSHETPNASHVFTEDQNGNQTHVEEPSASTYSSGQPEHTNGVSNKVVEPFDPPTLSLNLDLLGTLPTTSSNIFSVSTPILSSQGSHVLYSPLASDNNNNNPSVPISIHPFPTFHQQQQQQTPSQPHFFPVYQSNRFSPPLHSNVQQQPSHYPWNLMPPPILAYFHPVMPLAPDYTENSDSSSAPVIIQQQNIFPTETTDATSPNAFIPGTDASHEKESHKRQEYLMHVYFPNI